MIIAINFLKMKKETNELKQKNVPPFLEEYIYKKPQKKQLDNE